ncbi:hypothetical protein GN241_07515 [Rhodobacteraceae bacterium IMCC1335]
MRFEEDAVDIFYECIAHNIQFLVSLRAGRGSRLGNIGGFFCAIIG